MIYYDTLLGQPSERESKSYLSTNAELALLDPPAHPETLGRLDEFDIEEKIGQGGNGSCLAVRAIQVSNPRVKHLPE